MLNTDFSLVEFKIMGLIES